MDPVTIGTTITTLVATCGKAATVCNGLLGKYKNAPQILASIRTECATIKSALSYVDWLVKRDTKLLSSQLEAHNPLAETLDVALTGCTVTFSLLDIELQKLYNKSEDQDGYKYRDKMKYIWDESLAKSILDHMRGLQGAVNLVLTALQTGSLSALSQLLHDQRPIIERVRQNTRSIRESHSSQQGAPADGSHSEDYSIFDSTIGEETFSFDDEIVNSVAYREAIKRLASRHRANEQRMKPGEPHILDEPLIDLEGTPHACFGPDTDGNAASQHHCVVPTIKLSNKDHISKTIIEDLTSLMSAPIDSSTQPTKRKQVDAGATFRIDEDPYDINSKERDTNATAKRMPGPHRRDSQYVGALDSRKLPRKQLLASIGSFPPHDTGVIIAASTKNDFDQRGLLPVPMGSGVSGSDERFGSTISERAGPPPTPWKGEVPRRSPHIVHVLDSPTPKIPKIVSEAIGTHPNNAPSINLGHAPNELEWDSATGPLPCINRGSYTILQDGGTPVVTEGRSCTPYAVPSGTSESPLQGTSQMGWTAQNLSRPLTTPVFEISEFRHQLQQDIESIFLSGDEKFVLNNGSNKIDAAFDKDFMARYRKERPLPDVLQSGEMQHCLHGDHFTPRADNGVVNAAAMIAAGIHAAAVHDGPRSSIDKGHEMSEEKHLSGEEETPRKILKKSNRLSGEERASRKKLKEGHQPGTATASGRLEPQVEQVLQTGMPRHTAILPQRKVKDQQKPRFWGDWSESDASEQSKECESQTSNVHSTAAGNEIPPRFTMAQSNTPDIDIAELECKGSDPQNEPAEVEEKLEIELDTSERGKERRKRSSKVRNRRARHEIIPTSHNLQEQSLKSHATSEGPGKEADSHHESQSIRESQTQLLLEYFEGGKGPDGHPRPHVRVRVTPSNARKINEATTISVESGEHGKPSYSRRISLVPSEFEDTRAIKDPNSNDSNSHGSAAAAMSSSLPTHPAETPSTAPDVLLEETKLRVPRHNRTRSRNRQPLMSTENQSELPSENRSRRINKKNLALKGLSGGALTAEALKYHNRSKSSSDQRERRRRGSIKDNDQNADITESTWDPFAKYGIPQMPMQSEIVGSEVTRDSILSARTEEPLLAPEEIRNNDGAGYPYLHKSRRLSPIQTFSKRHESELNRDPIGRGEGDTSGGDKPNIDATQTPSRRRSPTRYLTRPGTRRLPVNVNPISLEEVREGIRRLVAPEVEKLKLEQSRLKRANIP